MKDKNEIEIIRIQDNPIVRVNGNLEASIKLLRRKVASSKIFKILKIRRYHPAPADRRRLKKIKSIKRFQQKIINQKKHEPIKL